MSPVEITPEFNPLRLPSDRRLNRIAGPSALIIFGVTGDLARKKLMPAVYDLANRGLLPPGFALVGFARRDWVDQDFAQVVHDAVAQYARTPFDENVWKQLAEGIRFVQGEFDDDKAFAELKKTLEELDETRGTMGNHAFYLSIPPKSFPQVTEQLRRSGLADEVEGATVDAREVLFEIVDPSKLVVEALAFDVALLSNIGAASASPAAGVSVPLTFLGAGRAQREGAIPLQFRTLGSQSVPLTVNQPVKVLVRTKTTIKGVAVPASAIVKSASNQDMVWAHTGAETFSPRPVRVAPLDGATVSVVDGLKAGERVVTQGAALVNQVR